MNKVSSSKNPRQIGLARALSKLGYCSRSKAGALISSGRVEINGAIRRNPEAPVHLGKDQIQVDGRSIQAEAKLYFILNKPRGVVTTASDEKGRTTVFEFLSKDIPHLTPVGRLDKASEGLLLFTNDSEWAAKLLAPETHLNKAYHVQVGVVAEGPLLELLRKGVKTKDGDVLRVKDAKLVRSGDKNSWLEVVLDEGKNRHIRRMFEAHDIEVLRLIRVAIGPIPLGNLAKGQSRELTVEEKRLLDQAMQESKSRGRNPKNPQR
jgi:23S rRNA pseudouridine2605 synthase